MSSDQCIVGYTFRGFLYGPECIAAVLAQAGFPVSPGELDNAEAAEAMLDDLAHVRGVDRLAEWRLDSGDFPKVVHRDQIGDDDDCANCGRALA